MPILSTPRRRRKPRGDGFTLLHHVPVQQSGSGIAAWLSQCDAGPPPLPSINSGYPRRRRRTLDEIHHNQLAVDMDVDASKTEQRPRARGRNGSLKGEGSTGVRRSGRLAGTDALAADFTGVVAIQQIALKQPAPESATAMVTPNDAVPVFPAPESTISSSTRRAQSRSSSPSKRTPITKREDLQHFTPPTHVINNWRKAREDYGMERPAVIAKLWEHCNDCAVTDLENIPYFAAASPNTKTAVELILQYALEQAGECRDAGAPESQWIAKVIQPILNTLELLPFAKRTTAGANDKVVVMDIRTTEMDPECVPKPTLDRFTGLDKKIDLAIGLELHHKTKVAICASQLKSINQTSTFVHQNPLFLNIEVKRAYAGTDPVIQLAVWTAGEFIQRRTDGVDVSMPALALEIEGDYWRLYAVVAKAESEDGPLELGFVGPVDIGDTAGEPARMYKLYSNLCQIAHFGRTEYLFWFENMVIDTLPGA